MNTTTKTYEELDFKLLFTCQQKLDIYIREKNGITEAPLLGTINALMVEVGEFLNEVRAFKHWSVKGMSKDLAYEEYVDGLHFLLSIGNIRWGAFQNVTVSKNKDTQDDFFVYDETNQASKNEFIEKSIMLYNIELLLSGTLDQYFEYLSHFIAIGKSIGMTETVMMNEYMKKHEKNYTRQLSGNY